MKIKRTKHGMDGTPTHTSWRAMRQRCNHINNKDYKYYKGKNISYDPSWENFLNFLKDMGERPEGHTLDRIDNTKGYFKENCRWATPIQQSFNRGSWSSTGIRYIQKYKYGYRVKISGIVCKRVKTIEEALQVREINLKIKEKDYATT